MSSRQVHRKCIVPTAVSAPSESDRSSSTVHFYVSASNQAKLLHKHSWCQINRQKSSIWLLIKYRCGMASVEDAEGSGRPSIIKGYWSVTHPVSWTQGVVSTTWGVVSLGPCMYKINVTLSQFLVNTSIGYIYPQHQMAMKLLWRKNGWKQLESH